MSRFYTISFLIFLFVLLLSSCQEELVYIEEPPIIDTSISNEFFWTPLSSYQNSDFQTSKIYGYGDKFVETKHAIIFIDTRNNALLRYINKQTGEVRVLCGDPLCKHTEKEMCSAVCDVSTGSSLVYSPVNGRLYYVRRNDMMASVSERFSNIISIDIDSMDFSVKYHYSLEPGNEITSMKHCNGKIYFTHIVEKDEEEKLILSSLTLSNDKTEDICYFDYIETCFIVQNDVVYYYNTGDNILHAYDMINQTTETLIDTKSVNRYFITQNTLTCQTPATITATDLMTKQTQTVFSSAELGANYDYTSDASGNIYFYGYTPVTANTTRGQQKNYSGGKIYKLSNGTAELYIDLGDTTFIKSICAIQKILFIETYTYGENKNTVTSYYYTMGDKIQELP